jgi:hypothetical protein
VDKHPPSVVLGIGHNQTVAAAVANGVKLSITCSEPCTAKFKLRLGKTLIGSKTAKLKAAGKKGVRIPLSSSGQSALKGGHGNAHLSLNAKVSDTTGNTRKLVRHGTLTR